MVNVGAKHSVMTSKTLDEDALKIQLGTLNLLRDVSDGNLKSIELGETTNVASKFSLFEKKPNLSKTINLKDSGDEKGDESKTFEKILDNLEEGEKGILLSEEKSAAFKLNEEPTNGLSTPPEINYAQDQNVNEGSVSFYRAINDLVAFKFEEVVNKDDSQLPKSLDAKLNLEPQEKCLTSFACAFAQTILLQGRLYILSSNFSAKQQFQRME